MGSVLLNSEAERQLILLSNTLIAKAYATRSIRNYVQEMRFIFAHFNHLSPAQITQSHIYEYLQFIKKEHGVGRDKCRMAASACSFFFKYVLPTPYVIPRELYPRKEFRLPDILSVEEVNHLISSIKNIKHKTIIGLFYGAGLRLNELRYLKMSDIQRKNSSIKVVAGKGSKDRFTLFPHSIFPVMERYYRLYRPQVYLFEGQTPGVPMNDRSIQHAVSQAMKEAGFEVHKYSSHTLRHCFATHLLDSGTDIHTIKELLGHSNLETTMIYLHLSKQRREKIVSPLDMLINGNGSII